jgi:hypothetical protein
MNDLIKKAIEQGRLAILFGAGASLTSTDKYGKNLLSGAELAELLAREAGKTYTGEKLAQVCGAVKVPLGERFFTILEDKYKHCKPSDEYINFAKFPWVRIYTINIDDALDVALVKNSPQRVNVRHCYDKVTDQSQLFNEVDYVKINGSVDRIDKDLIFSTKDYGKAAAKSPLWYKELAEDYFKYMFLFIGTQLDEPLFYHQIERHRMESSSVEQRSYVLTPKATDVEKDSLLNEHNIEHISCTFGDFIKWLLKTFPSRLSPLDLAVNKNPALGVMLSLGSSEDKKKYVGIFKHVISVSRSTLTKSDEKNLFSGKIRNFYKGFKPFWDDIIDGVPAELKSTKEFYEIVLNASKNNEHLAIVYGPAGSGKTTLLKQVALEIADKEGIPVFFIEEPIDNLENIVVELESINDRGYVLFYDRIDILSNSLKSLISDKIIKKGLIVGAESQSVWENRTKSKIGSFCKQPYQLSLIDENDAKSILAKLERFGPWTRLCNLSENKRIEELVAKAKRQLLVGLFEATYGVGYEKIIENEYSKLSNEEEKIFLALVGFATMHKVYINESYINRALSYLGVEKSANFLANKMGGIISYQNSKLFARHPVYIRHLFDQVIASQLIYDALCALLYSYTVYEVPVIKHVTKNESLLFKSIINHKFLKDIFRGQREYILGVYESFEKPFENDGLFWLQYGLALRDLNSQDESLEKIQTAYNAYPQPHTEHALAQQELIIATLTESKEKAFSLLNTAKDRLESLDIAIESDDTYPIVTLAEGHTKILRKFCTQVEAQDIARYYANIIEKRFRSQHQPRLKKAWAVLSTFATTGSWRDDDLV